MDMVEFGLQQIGLELGTGAVIGGLIGFTAKKVAKIIAFLIGLELALFKFLESQGILAVDWERLSAGLVNASSAAGDAATANQPPGVIVSFLSVIPVSAGFTGGFFVGFKKG
ncbi:FUN14 domain-containing protein [Halosimplex salinum]|uniref:FUN14 domain-containing protein n=1 Tax=Halosimplex salinum TaxID=1710538 RepID=UPI000F474F44